MMKLRAGLVLAACGLLFCGGCVSVKAPERIEVDAGGHSRPERVDSSRVPNPHTLEEARAELNKAYSNIQWLEDRVANLEKDKAKYKRERDECRDRLEKYEDD
jgi:hypothetical protein